MQDPRPTRDDKFTFGLWTVGWQARDPFGDATRPPLDPVETVHRLAELGAYGVTFHDDDLIPFGSDDADPRRAHHAVPRGAGRDRPGRADGDHQPVHPPGLQGRRRSPATTATSAATRCARSCATSTSPPSWAPRPTSSGAAARAPSPTPPRTSGPRSTATARASTCWRQYVIDQGYGMRFAIEPKPNEPRGDILLPTVGHALAFIADARAPRHGRPQPRGRPRADGRAQLRRTASPRRCGTASCSTSTSTASTGSSTTRTWCSATATCSTRSSWSTCWRTAPDGGPAYDGPRHFDYKPLRTEDIDGVWASAAANMRTYLLLKERAAAFRADPEVQEALAARRVAELRQPTLSPGETLRRPARRPSAFEDFDVDAAGRARLRLRPARPARDRAPARRR